MGFFKTKYALVLLLLVILLIGVLQFIPALDYDGLSANTRRQTFAVCPVKVNIGFKMKVYSMATLGNVFQTAAGNEGLRMELSNPSFLSIVASERDYLVKSNIQTNQWYDVKIEARNPGALNVFVDGLLVVAAADPALHFKFDDVALGTGFNKTRPFFGKIKCFRMTIDSDNHASYRLVETAQKILWSFFSVLILLLIVRWLGEF